MKHNHIIECRAVSRQRLSKHVPVAVDTLATIEVLLETAFYARSMQTDYMEVN
jgi:hypothetical protein